MTAIEQIPGIGPYLPWITLAITLASVLAAAMPPPSPASATLYVTAYNIIHLLAQNWGHAKAASAPDSPKPPAA